MFAHPSEALVAEELDHLGIRWLYEPTLLELEPGAEPKLGMRPDFYLLDHDLYLEVSWGDQRSKKNAKVRALEQRGVHVTLLRRHDFKHLRESILLALM